MIDLVRDVRVGYQGAGAPDVEEVRSAMKELFSATADDDALSRGEVGSFVYPGLAGPNDVLHLVASVEAWLKVGTILAATHVAGGFLSEVGKDLYASAKPHIKKVLSAIPILARNFAAARARGAHTGFAIESSENTARNAALLVETSDPRDFFEQMRAFADAAPVLSLFLSSEPVIIKGLEARPAAGWNDDCSTKIELTPDKRAALRIRLCEPGTYRSKHEFWIVTGDHRLPGRLEPDL